MTSQIHCGPRVLIGLCLSWLFFLVSSQNGRFSHFQMGFSLQQGLPNWSPQKMVRVHICVLSDLLSMHLLISTNTYLLWHRCFSQQSISKRGPLDGESNQKMTSIRGILSVSCVSRLLATLFLYFLFILFMVVSTGACRLIMISSNHSLISTLGRSLEDLFWAFFLFS